MRVFIGLDGGGTGCRAVAELESGARSAVLTGGPANFSTDRDAALVQVTRLLAQTLQAAQTLAPGTSLGPPCIVLGLAGIIEAGAHDWLREALPHDDISILGDIDIALMGAFWGADGLVVVVGTGSALAAQRGGQMRRIGGHGLGVGDQASGAWIGREALRATALAQDGLGVAGPLTQAICQRFGTIAQMIAFARDASPADHAALAPLVLAHPHCPVAGAILDAACAYLVRGIAQLQADGPALPVAGLGGLGPALLTRMQAQGAALHLTRPRGNALDGALWSARQGAR